MMSASTARTAELQAQWWAALQQLHGLAVSIATERQRGNEAGVRALRPVFVAVATKAQGLAEQLHVEEAALTWIERFLVDLDTGVTAMVKFPQWVLKTSGLTGLLWVGLGLYALTLLAPWAKVAQSRARSRRGSHGA